MFDALTTIRSKRAEIARRIEALTAEDRELATTEAVLERLRGAKPSQAAANVPIDRPRNQREFVLDALARAETPWVRSGQIVELAYGAWGERIPELSLRPLLTQLKKSGEIVRDGRLIALRRRAHQPRAKANMRPG